MASFLFVLARRLLLYYFMVKNFGIIPLSTPGLYIINSISIYRNDIIKKYNIKLGIIGCPISLTAKKRGAKKLPT